MSLPFSSRKSSEPSISTSRGSRGLTSQGSTRPLTTSSRGALSSVTSSQQQLPEKQLLSRYRHVYAGKGGWYQGRAGNASQASSTSASGSRHLDVYRKELIMKLSKDIFENSKQKMAKAEYVASNKVAGDPNNNNDVHNVVTKYGEESSGQLTTVETETNEGINPPSRLINRDELANMKTNATGNASKLPMKPVFHSLPIKNARQSRGASDESHAKNLTRFNLRGGSTKIENTPQQQRISSTAAAGYKPSDSNNHANIPINNHNINQANKRPATNHETTSNNDALNTTNQSKRPSQVLQVVHEQKVDNHISTPNNHMTTTTKADPDSMQCEPPGPAETDLLDPGSLFSALKRSKTFHHGESTVHNHSLAQRGVLANKHAGLANGPQEIHSTQREVIDKHKEGPQNSDHVSQYLTSEENKNKNSSDQKRKDTKELNTGLKQNTQALSNVNDTVNTESQTNQNKNDKKCTKENNSADNAKSQHVENNAQDILGEIQFNVLRQRSFIRVPKSAAARDMLDNERPITRGGARDSMATDNVISRQILSRMSLSKEARDALLETQNEMRRDSLINLDQIDGIEKKQEMKSLHCHDRRPNAPDIESSPEESLSGKSSARNSLHSGSNPSVQGIHTHRNKHHRHHHHSHNTDKQGKNKPPTHKGVPRIECTDVDKSRDKFNTKIENARSPKRSTRETTVSTPITDLMHSMTPQPHGDMARYSTNMTKDNTQFTPRTGGRANSRNNARKISTTTKTPGANTQQQTIPINNPNTKTHLLTVPFDNHNSGQQKMQIKKSKHSYTVPLRAGPEVAPGAAAEVADVESVRSDWESQMRAMSRYALATEKSFQITPPGWDERYKDLARRNSRPEKESNKDLDVTLAEVKEKAVEKCSDWLQRYG